MKTRLLIIMAVFLVITILQSSVLALEKNTIPPALESWKQWVLHDMEERFCPTPYNNGDKYLCMWPSRLKLDLHAKGGRFTQEWAIFKKEWVPEFKGIEKIIVCFDNDKPGKSGSKRLLKLLSNNTDSKLYWIELPSEVGSGGDLTDFFIKKLTIIILATKAKKSGTKNRVKNGK